MKAVVRSSVSNALLSRGSHAENEHSANRFQGEHCQQQTLGKAELGKRKQAPDWLRQDEHRNKIADQRLANADCGKDRKRRSRQPDTKVNGVELAITIGAIEDIAQTSGHLFWREYSLCGYNDEDQRSDAQQDASEEIAVDQLSLCILQPNSDLADPPVWTIGICRTYRCAATA